MTFQNPWMLVLLLLLPIVGWRWWRRAPHSAVRFSSIAWLKREGTGFRVIARNLLPFLRMPAVAVLVVCLARPQKGNEETRIFSEGIAVQMLVDRSSSMHALDFTVDGKRVNRLAAVKRVFKEFVLGGEGLDGRPDDLIGMITFAAYADGKCPMTLDHAFLVETLEQTEIVSPEEGREEDGTAIGDAIALAVERMRDLEQRREVVRANRITGKVMILLTDGANNAGVISPEDAAELARALDIRVYTIGAGKSGITRVPMRDPFGTTTLVPMRSEIDEETLKRIASITGARFFRATDTDSLREIYAEIDKLEKTETEEKRYMQWAELATEGVEFGGFRFPALLWLPLAALVLEAVVINTWFRKIP